MGLSVWGRVPDATTLPSSRSQLSRQLKPVCATPAGVATLYSNNIQSLCMTTTIQRQKANNKGQPFIEVWDHDLDTAPKTNSDAAFFQAPKRLMITTGLRSSYVNVAFLFSQSIVRMDMRLSALIGDLDLDVHLNFSVPDICMLCQVKTRLPQYARSLSKRQSRTYRGTNDCGFQ